MPPGLPIPNARACARRQALLLLSVLVCGIESVPAQSPFPGQSFTYSNPPIDVAAVIAGRNNEPQTRSDRTIVAGGSRIDPSEPTHIFFATGLAPAARPGDYPTREMLEGIMRTAMATPSARYVSIPRLMQDIADEYAEYRELLEAAER